MKPVRYGSVCSGIEAATVAWHRLDWKPAWFAEIEKFPSAVLAHHYPAVPNLGDMTALPKAVLLGQAEAPDVLVGGTPCQAFSVAGMREGLNDPRGQLTIKFVELADAIDHVRLARGDDPAVVVWENVPGVLSDKGNAFGCFLGALAGEDCELVPPGGKWPNAGFVSGPARTIAWRVLDAQYFGVAQRRRRVFVVASARDGFHPAQVLFEFDGVRRDSPPSREPGEEVTPTIRAGAPNGGKGHGARSGDSKDELIVPVECFGGGNTRGSLEVAARLTARGMRIDYEVETFAVQQQPVAFTQNSRSEVRLIGGDGGVVGALAAEPGAQQQNYVAAPISFPANLSGTQCASTEDLAPAMGAKNPTTVACMDVAGTMKACKDSGGWSNSADHAAAGYMQPVLAFKPGQSEAAGGAFVTEEYAPTLQAINNGSTAVPAVQTAMQVRRLIPVECERLQGFPDGYTAIPWRNKPAEECPDGPRYKALGNSMAVPCMEWIGRRIDVRLRACSGSILKPGGLNG